MAHKDEKVGFEMQSSKNDSEAMYESLTKTQQDKTLFRRIVYLMGFLLVLIFLITVVNLALNWSQLKSSSDCGSTEKVTPVPPQELKAKDSEIKEETDATRMRQFNVLRGQVEEMKDSILNEVKQQKDAMANVTTLVSNNRTGISCPSSNNGLKVAIEMLEIKMKNLAALVNETCPRPVAYSCNELYKRNPLLKSGAYHLMFGSEEVPVYCHMGKAGNKTGCGDGGWTLAMKMNGTKGTFHYNSPLWGNKEPLNLPGGMTGFDNEETKMPTYWSTPFSKICVGMMVDQQTNFFVIDKRASSLYSLIADGQYRNTSLGRDTWKSLIGSEASLQGVCNREGFNTVCENGQKARIGILSNNENDCNSCDSRIGFGAAGFPDDQNTCGNAADGRFSPDNGDKHIKALGFILVQ